MNNKCNLAISNAFNILLLIFILMFSFILLFYTLTFREILISNVTGKQLLDNLLNDLNNTISSKVNENLTCYIEELKNPVEITNQLIDREIEIFTQDRTKQLSNISLDDGNDTNNINDSIGSKIIENTNQIIEDTNSLSSMQENAQLKTTQLENDNSNLPQYTILTNQKNSLVQAFNSSDDSTKLSTINSLFSFENEIANAKYEYNYSNILKSTDNKIDLKNKKILIFHTHSQEMYKDSTTSEEDGIIAIGEELAKILKEKYNLNVIHYTGKHDVLDGKLNRDGSYERVEEAIEEILNEDKDIEILIDLHRDGVPESTKLVTEINNKKCAQIMLVNGICKLNNKGKIEDISYLPNEYVTDNLNLSMNVQIAANNLYPSLSRKILVKPYRYSLNMKPNSLLIELGAQNNTVEEVRNTLPYLAEIIYTGIKNKNEKF